MKLLVVNAAVLGFKEKAEKDHKLKSAKDEINCKFEAWSYLMRRNPR